MGVFTHSHFHSFTILVDVHFKQDMDEIVKQGMAKWPNVPGCSDSDSLAMSLLSARLRDEAPGRRT